MPNWKNPVIAFLLPYIEYWQEDSKDGDNEDNKEDDKEKLTYPQSSHRISPASA